MRSFQARSKKMRRVLVSPLQNTPYDLAAADWESLAARADSAAAINPRPGPAARAPPPPPPPGVSSGEEPPAQRRARRRLRAAACAPPPPPAGRGTPASGRRAAVVTVEVGAAVQFPQLPQLPQPGRRPPSGVGSPRRAAGAPHSPSRRVGSRCWRRGAPGLGSLNLLNANEWAVHVDNDFCMFCPPSPFCFCNSVLYAVRRSMQKTTYFHKQTLYAFQGSTSVLNLKAVFKHRLHLNIF